MPRPKGVKNKKGYTMSPAAWNQRVLAPMKKGSYSKIFNTIIEKEAKDPQFGEDLKRFKLEFWKRTANSPALALLDIASELYAFIELERSKSVSEGDGVLNKSVLQATRALVDIMKELSRVSMVSADKKAEFLRDMDKLEFEIPEQFHVAPPSDDTPSGGDSA